MLPETPSITQPVSDKPRLLTVGIITAVIAAVLTGGGVYLYLQRQASITREDLQSQINSLKDQLAALSPTPSVSPTTSPSASASATPTPPGSTFKSDHLIVNKPVGWTADPVSNNPDAVNMSKDNYILYINANASQASGVTGGRFAEIAQGAPSADTVIQTWPSDPCAPAAFTPATSYGKLFTQRADLYVSNSSKSPVCKAPSDGSTAWYFSYLTGSKGYYFNDYTAGQNPAFVATMSYKTSDVNSLPKKDSPALKSMLDEMTSIASTAVVSGL